MQDLPMALDADISQSVLIHLGLSLNWRPDLDFLDRLVASYTEAIPWESATRIARRAQFLENDRSLVLDHFPRWPAEFWLQAIESGAGGTCFESNYAFFTLLRALGYTGYLTVNNMGESIACHSAIVVKLGEQSWLVDVGFPVYAPVPLRPDETSQRQTAFHRYTISAGGPGRYHVDRDLHPNRYCFTLVDAPVPDKTYRSITAADYGPGGLFLDRVVINKVISGCIWRFDSAEQPFKIERFQDGRKTEYAIKEQEPGINNLVAVVAGRFNMPADTIRLALTAVI